MQQVPPDTMEPRSGEGRSAGWKIPVVCLSIVVAIGLVLLVIAVID